MDTKSDTLLLSYKGNAELKKALGDYQPGDTCELTIEVTVRANDDETFDAVIDAVEPSESMGYEEEEEGEDEANESKISTRPDRQEDMGNEPALVIVAARKSRK